MITKKPWYPILYMFIITAVFSFVIIAFSILTSDRVKANQTAAFETAVLQVLPGLYDPSVGSMKLHAIFLDDVNEPDESSAGAYTLTKDGQLIAYALPFEGKGFWATIKGVIGIAADKQTITGIAFYEQNETPGLGAEITKQPFKEQFAGKVISTSAKPLKMKRPGEQLGDSEIHAVTGATQTSTRLEKIINDALKEWKQDFEQIKND